MSIHLTGSKHRVVHKVQERLDRYFDKKQAYETAHQQLSTCAAENVPLTDIPSHEARYQDLLSRCSLAANELKCAANDVKKKTDPHHIDKYFHKRRDGKINRICHAGPRNISDIDSCYKGSLEELYKVACQISSIDYNTPIEQARAVSQKNAQSAQVQIEQIRKQEAADQEYSSIDITFPACQDKLIIEHPREYLRQSALYQHKLIHKGDHKAALTFGKSWIKNPPKEATWEDVEQMSLRQIDAAQSSGDTDLTEYYIDLELWSEAHPPPASTSPDQATTPLGRRVYLQGLILLHTKDSILNPKAFQTYQACSLLHPDQPIWKVTQALCHISNLKWVEADELLKDLPADDPAASHAQSYLMQKKQERICLATLDVGILALSRFLPTNFKNTAIFDVTHTVLQLIAHPSSKRVWLPRVLTVPEQPMPIGDLLLSSSGLNLALDTVNLIFRNGTSSTRLQNSVSLVSATAQTVSRAWVTYTNREIIHPFDASTIIQVTSSLITLNQAYDHYQEHRRSPTCQALVSTVQKVMHEVSDIITMTSYADLLPLAGLSSTFMTKRINAIPLADQLFSKPTAQRNKRLLIASGVALLASYRFYNDYPSLWAAHVMREANWYCSQQKYDDALHFISEAENSYFIGSVIPVIQSYAGYIEKLKNYSANIEDPALFESFMKSLDHSLTLLKQNLNYTNIRHHLLQKKLIIALTRQDLDTLKTVLEEKPDKIIIDSGVTYLLNSAFYMALKNPATTTTYLQKIGHMLSSHTEISLLATHLTNHAERLQKLPHHTLSSLIQEKTSLESTKQSIQELQRFFKKHVGSKGVYQELQFYKLLLTFTLDPLSVDVLFKELEPEGHRRFSCALIEATKHQDTHFLDQACFPSHQDCSLIKHYKNLLSLRESSFEEQLQVLDKCVECLEKEDIFHKEIYEFLSAYRIALYFNAEKYHDARELLAQEIPDSHVHQELATYLFEKMNHTDGLTKIVKELKNWKHRPFFQTVLFETCLHEQKIAEAKTLLEQSEHDPIYPELCKKTFHFLIQTGEQLRQTIELKATLDYVQSLNQFFAIPQSNIIQNYILFLAHLEQLQKENNFTGYAKVNDQASQLLTQLQSTGLPVPETLKKDIAKIKLKLALIAKQTGQEKIALTVFQSIQQLHIQEELTLQFIDKVKQQFSNIL